MGAGCQDLVSNQSPSAVPTRVQASSEENQTAKDQELFQAVLREYFQYIDDREYKEAYKMLSMAFQATHPFLEWSDGYKNTLSHSMKSAVCEDGSCVVEFVATENTSTNLRKQRYVLQYFLRKESGVPKIYSGALLSTNTVEILKEYGTTSFTKDSQITASVVQILCFSDDSFSEVISSGSGTIIRDDGILLSNLHVKAPAPGECIAVGVNNQGIMQPDKIYPIIRTIFQDQMRDIWVAQLTTTNGATSFPALSYKPCTTEQVKLGDAVRIYGFPFRAAKGNMLITDGIVSGINADDGMFVTSAKVDHGNSGGTALNTSKSCFIGIPTAIRGESEVYGQIAGIADLVSELPGIFSEDR